MDKIEIYGTISGSIRKFWDEIIKCILEFEKNGVKILSPKISLTKNLKDDFVYLINDKSKPIETIEKTHLLNISHSDFLFVVNPKGYIGISTSLEIGFALSKGIKVYSLEKPSDTLLKEYITYNLSILEMIDHEIERKREKIDIKENLSDMQKYFCNKIIERGFDKETEEDLLILILEELGELSKIIRTFSGLKIKKETLKQKKQFDVGEELADILIYIIILANKFGVDLYNAIKIKEMENEKRDWIVFDPNSKS